MNDANPGKAIRPAVRPAAERPPKRREETVSDPDQYADDPPAPKAGRPAPPGAGTVSNPDF